MGTMTKKRTRSEKDAASSALAKRRPPPPAADSDIDSDEADSVIPSDIEDQAPSTPEPSTPENETAEEKRLRLARAYLKHIGVSEDAANSSSSDDEDEARTNGLLRESALQASGRATQPIADGFAQRLGSATRTVCRGHALPPTCVALADGEEGVVVSGGKDSRVIVWDAETGKKRVVFKADIEKRYKKNPALADGHVGNVLTVAVTDDGNMAVSGGDDGLIRVWDVRAGKLIENMRGHRGPVHGLAFRNASRQLFSASRDRTVKVWDMNDMAYVETLFGHGGEVNSIDSLAKERAVSCGRDGTLRLYKIVEGSQLVFRRAMTVSIDVVAMVNEQRFVSGGDDGAVCLWQLNKKKPTAVVEKAHGGGLGCESWISSVAAFRHTDLAISGAGDGRLQFWKCEQVPKLVKVGEIDVGPGFVNGIATGRRYNLMAVAVGTEHRLGRWGRTRGAKNTIQILRLPS